MLKIVPVYAVLGLLLSFAAGAVGAPRDIYSDTWAASDALGRSLPLGGSVAGPRSDRTVGMFYFLTFDRGGDGPRDNTQILTSHPEAVLDIHNPAWGPLNESHYWGKPLFGYYASDDEYILRKHAEMLSNAGVDMVIFDNSNAVTYDPARETLCRVWEQIRREGGKTPQIAFLCPFGNPDNIGNKTLLHLYKQLYRPGHYQDLWYKWRGKPLVMADQSFADPFPGSGASRVPAPLSAGRTLGQTFHADDPFVSVGGEFPTWGSKGSGVRLTLRRGSHIVLTKTFRNVRDNATVSLSSTTAIPAGTYTLTMSNPVGQIGWWSYDGDFAGGHAVADGQDASGFRALHITDAARKEDISLPDLKSGKGNGTSAELSAEMHKFFAFRTPIAPYNITHPTPGQWAWLQVFPQAVQSDSDGNPEQITVGVAQNYNAIVNNTAPMSVPGAFGRSFHGGKEDVSPDATAHGYNFQEQWQRALQMDPPFVFVTGWNEWTAGFMDSWVRWQAPPPIFVDEYTQEFSRDIEPMTGGHSDNYYYQLAANIRKYKGARLPEPIRAAPIKIDGSFADWTSVGPEFRDNIFDTVHRNSPGAGNAGPYVNNSGRNDIETAKVSYDSKNVYFYVRTRQTLTNPSVGDWMKLYIDADNNAKTGWLGYDFAVNLSGVHDTSTTLSRSNGTGNSWKIVSRIASRRSGREMEIAIPRRLLGVSLKSGSRILFKWADHCYRTGKAEDFTLYGDAAPDDRFSYVAGF